MQPWRLMSSLALAGLALALTGCATGRCTTCASTKPIEGLPIFHVARSTSTDSKNFVLVAESRWVGSTPKTQNGSQLAKAGRDIAKPAERAVPRPTAEARQVAVAPASPYSMLAPRPYLPEAVAPKPDSSGMAPAKADEVGMSLSPTVALLPKSAEKVVPAVAVVETNPTGRVPERAVGKRHADDYSWVEGRLEFLESRKVWRLRFEALDSDDPHGGVFTLAGDDEVFEGFKPGQSVRVEGAVADPEARTVAPAYRVSGMRQAK